MNHIPLNWGDDDWHAISNGLIEHADVFEFVPLHFYGKNEW